MNSGSDIICCFGEWLSKKGHGPAEQKNAAISSRDSMSIFKQLFRSAGVVAAFFAVWGEKKNKYFKTRKRGRLPQFKPALWSRLN